MKICRHLRVSGRVQGVFFRDSMVAEATRLEVTGWVRNRADGSVEAVAQGSPEAVTSLIEWAHRGPELAVVVRVEVTEAKGSYDRFTRLASK